MAMLNNQRVLFHFFAGGLLQRVMKSHQPVGDGIVQVMGCSKKMVDHVSSGSAIGYAVTIPIVVPLSTFLGGHVHQFCLGCPLWPTLEIDDYMHVLVDCTPGCTHPTILSFVHCLYLCMTT